MLKKLYNSIKRLPLKIWIFISTGAGLIGVFTVPDFFESVCKGEVAFLSWLGKSITILPNWVLLSIFFLWGVFLLYGVYKNEEHRIWRNAEGRKKVINEVLLDVKRLSKEHEEECANLQVILKVYNTHSNRSSEILNNALAKMSFIFRIYTDIPSLVSRELGISIDSLESTPKFDENNLSVIPPYIDNIEDSKFKIDYRKMYEREQSFKKSLVRALRSVMDELLECERVIFESTTAVK